MSSPANYHPSTGLVSNFFQSLAYGFNNVFSRQAANETSQGDSQLGISPISCRCHLSDEMAWILDMIFASDLDAPENTIPEWKVFLRVSAHDIPRLMREGFYWSEANVDRERGEFEGFPREDDPNFVRFCRTYYLDDLADDPQWAAQLTVHSYDLQTLSEFRLRDLSIEDILIARAFRPRGHEVYYYHVNKPQHFINAIYDDMPLRGWWPWPREEGAEEETADEVEAEI